MTSVMFFKTTPYTKTYDIVFPLINRNLMQKSFTVTLLLLLGVNMAFSQSKKEKDVEAIKSMCGCYEVKFNFAETFNYVDDPAYKPSKIKHSGGLEWVQLVEEDDNLIVLQHLLIVGHGDESHIIKHWRQDWAYENRDFYMFNANNNWKYEQKTKSDVAGQWTQKVFQVDDSPRYEGTASWVHVDGKSYWENITNAPLPRREFTQRSDYNLTIRNNRQEITATGWIHDQDNKKVQRENGKDVIIAEEKGFNTYTKVEESKCKAAKEWWQENKDMWAMVRKNWDKVFAKKQDLTLKSKVDNKRLFEHLFALEPSSKPKEIKEIITGFVERTR